MSVFALRPAIARDMGGAHPFAHRVVVWDESSKTLAVVLDLVERCGAKAVVVNGLSRIQDLQVSPCAVVIATSSFGSSETARFDAITRLRARGCSVIAYEDGADAKPLAARCRLLLSGCTVLLDSAAERFAEGFARALSQLLSSEANREAEECALREGMRDLGIVGQSQSMLAVFRTVRRVGVLSDLPTLITGETGTGKELLARALHSQDAKRRGGPFVAVNCGAISLGLAETELFGHRRGAFTGADRDRKGLIRAAQGGVLFLDEIGELDLIVQTKLLRVLQESRVLAVGDEEEVPVSVRVIAATNCDLRALVDQGKFRPDFFYRLNTLSIHVPPLRERRADIPVLAEHFARKHRALNPQASHVLCAEFVEALASLDLPGNARELENLVRWALVHNDGTRPLDLGDLPPHTWQQLAEQDATAPHDQSSSHAEALSASSGDGSESDAGYPMKLLTANDWNLSRTLRSCERSIVQAALAASRGNQAKAARLLGITPRSVYNKVRRYRIP
jgi:transcriptional regulator with GAF, ATPase, and Fis domain